jgi:hypothetical protein
MSQVILHQSPSGLGNVAVCSPTGEVPINQVLESVKLQNPEAFIVDDSTLPQGDDAKFFDAWELNGTTVTVNFEKARAIKLTQFNAAAVAEAQKRQLNTLAAIDNAISDEEFTASLVAGRVAIAAATSTAELLAI